MPNSGDLISQTCRTREPSVRADPLRGPWPALHDGGSTRHALWAVHSPSDPDQHRQVSPRPALDHLEHSVGKVGPFSKNGSRLVGRSAHAAREAPGLRAQVVRIATGARAQRDPLSTALPELVLVQSHPSRVCAEVQVAVRHRPRPPRRTDWHAQRRARPSDGSAGCWLYRSTPLRQASEYLSSCRCSPHRPHTCCSSARRITTRLPAQRVHGSLTVTHPALVPGASGGRVARVLVAVTASY